MTDTTLLLDSTLPNDAVPPPQPPCHATRWRIATLVCLILLAIAAATGVSMMEQFKAQLTHLQTKLKSVPQTRYVSVLLDDKHQPAQLITFDPLDNYVLIQRLNEVKEGQEDSMQLWALDENDQALSLGVITPRIKTAQLPVTDQILSLAKGLAVSVEKKGGVEANQPPRLPYLFTGALIKKAL